MPINEENNRRAFDRLIGTLCSGHALGITGAGLSIWAGYGTWQHVIDRLADAVRERRGDEVDVDLVRRSHGSDLLHCARTLGGDLGRPAFEAFIQHEFGPRESPFHPLVQTFSKLPFQHIFTFNFEESLERAHVALAHQHDSVTCTDPRAVAQLLRNLGKSNCPRQIIHLHGKVSDAIERIALTEDGYAELYGNSVFKKLLWLLSATQSLVFVGFGFSDADFLHSLREGTRDVQRCGNCHFALIGLRPGEDDGVLRRYYNDNFLIDPIFYEIVDNDGHEDHNGFLALVNQIAEVTGGRVQAPRPGVVGTFAEAEELQMAERLTDQLIRRIDPGGNDV